MLIRTIAVILVCATAAPLAAAERPAVPMTRPGVVTRDLPAGARVVRPAGVTRAAPAKLPRANLARPDNVASRPILPRGNMAPINLPRDARPIMPILPGRPEARPTPPVILPRPPPVEGARPMPIERPVRPAS